MLILENILRKQLITDLVAKYNTNPVRTSIKRNTIFSEEGKVILFITKDKLEEMLYIKERGDDPGDLIMDEIEWFYLQHE